MNTVYPPEACNDCSLRMVCRCLRLTESAVIQTVTALGLRTVKEIRTHTGAGDGCTCCHAELKELLERHA